MTTLNFKGKSVIRTYHLTVPFRQLTPDPKKSLTKSPSLRDNLIVHGDNLLALKSLLPSFSGKVKCIYIDPPYNTGNEKWVYNDNVNSPMHQDWLKKVVDREDLTRHEKWLCMMWPRLVLLRELLAEDGAIFISIDDNEVHHLRAIMDEIFGEENFVETFIWRSRLGKGATSKDTARLHEYVLCYAKSFNNLDFKKDLRISEKDNKERLRQWGQGDKREDRPTMYYSVDSEEFGSVYPIRPDGIEGRWRLGKSEFNKLQAEGKVIFELQEDGRIEAYRIIPSGTETETAQDSILDSTKVKTTAHGSIELIDLFGKKIFDYPKPTTLIKHLLDVVNDKNMLVLDSFAGSATTAHATLALNAEDGGNRKFILIEQENYADKITAERVRRVIKGVKNSKNENLRNGFDGTFTYYTLGDVLVEENLLKGKKMPAYKDLARYVFFTATGEQLDDAQVDEKRFYLGESKNYQVYLLYKPDMEFLKHRPLDLDFVKSLGKPKNKTRLVIASHKYVDDFVLHDTRVEFCQLPFAIYRFRI
jgi:adenine-specific DNA-methyltransferase